MGCRARLKFVALTFYGTIEHIDAVRDHASNA